MWPTLLPSYLEGLGALTGPHGHEHGTEYRVLSVAGVNECGPVRTAPVESDRYQHLLVGACTSEAKIDPRPRDYWISLGLPSVLLASLFPLTTSLLAFAGGWSQVDQSFPYPRWAPWREERAPYYPGFSICQYLIICHPPGPVEQGTGLVTKEHTVGMEQE